MLYKHIQIQGLKGVGTVDLQLDESQSVCVLIGENGVGKTKTLEAFFQALLATNNSAIRSFRCLKRWVFSKIALNNVTYDTSRDLFNRGIKQHEVPILFLASQNRGFVQHKGGAIKPIGSFEQRQQDYFSRLIQGMDKNFSSLNMDVDIEQWFVTIAQSSNRYQKKADNREIELKTVLQLLHKVDSRINSDLATVEVSGDNRVSLTIDDEKRQLSHLSTGFASILKIIQSIVSGYGYFTNETQLQNVRGIVLIDEIESHMHLSWQAKIVPLLKQLFPNTTFYITTHSSMVLSQLNEGEAWRLQRDTDGVVRNQPITAPNKAVLVDVLKDAFGIDVNKMKRERMNAAEQQSAKRELLALIQAEDT